MLTHRDIKIKILVGQLEAVFAGGGITKAVAKAREETVPGTPLEVHTIGIRGEIKDVTKL